MANNRQTFTIAESPEAFKVLSSNLYSNPKLAVIRELCTNAYDAQIVADTNDEHPIELHLPTDDERFFRVRDWGNGLSEDEVFTIYTQFFSSTKKEDKNQIGAFGLGSKSPFAVTSKYKVNSYQNGEVKRYLMNAENSYPTVSLEATEKTDQHDGLEVIIEFDDDAEISSSSWREAAISLFKGTAFLPECNLTGRDMDEIFKDRESSTTENITWWKDAYKIGKSRYNAGKIIVNVAGACFEVNNRDNKIYSIPLNNLFYSSLQIYSITILAEKFDVTLTPSREELHYDKKTITFIRKAVCRVIKENIKSLNEKDPEDLLSLLSYQAEEDGIISNFCDKETISIIDKKLEKINTAFSGINKVSYRAMSLGTSQNFPFTFNSVNLKTLLIEATSQTNKGFYYVNFDGATKAQEKALDKLIYEGNTHNNVINCLGSHFNDDVLNNEKLPGKSVIYLFFNPGKEYSKIFNIKEIKIKDYENYFKRFNMPVEKSKKIGKIDNFINSQTLFFYNGYSADLDYLQEHKDELKDTKLLKVVGSTWHQLHDDQKMMKIYTDFIGENYVIAYRRGPQDWVNKRAAEKDIITRETFFKNAKSYNSEKYEMMKKALKIYSIETSYFSLYDTFCNVEKFGKYLNLKLLDKFFSWQIMSDPISNLAHKISRNEAYFLKKEVYKDENLSFTDKELKTIDNENKALKLLNAFSIYRIVGDEALIKEYCEVVNNLVKRYLESVAA